MTEPLPPRKTMTDGRFWAKTQIVGDCLEWTGWRRIDSQGRDGFDYGYVYRKGVRILAHRYAWQQAFGPIPDGAFVCHSCDNPPCVRPDHLFLGDASVNMRDMGRKGRASTHRLSFQQVQQIRSAYADGSRQVDLAGRFGVSSGYISEIVRNLTRVDY